MQVSPLCVHREGRQRYLVGKYILRLGLMKPFLIFMSRLSLSLSCQVFMHSKDSLLGGMRDGKVIEEGKLELLCGVCG